MGEGSHFDFHGLQMVDIGAKEISLRIARASARVRMQPETLAQLRRGQLPKGDVLQAARVAGIMAAKRTSELIPLCHPVPLDVVRVEFAFPDSSTVAIEAEARATARTGVEMEALVAAAVAALTIYDMCKGQDRAIVIQQVQLEEKLGGRSGHFLRGS
ncbi:MAG: cyclic pyranopterin monophosphate synthase MoaC [Thermoguttaceae bacterium]|nr:cyclic pyranopterin monophosphate synthase MoaC [Thermoguttaceae bacterium]MDW8037096.1 cyclic pyranopterin monophosphate synthase MoaC [Thermoguttaceae bacterium]